MKPKIGILTTFTGADEAYSLVNVVKVQLKMLLDNDYLPVLFVAPPFNGAGIFSSNRVEIRRVAMPDAKAQDIISALSSQLGDIDILFCHDIVFLSQHQEWAKAINIIATDHPRIAWVHWQHSRGDGNTEAHPERSWFAYPNRGDLEHCAAINQTDLAHVRYIPHPLDYDYLGWNELAIRIAEEHDYHLADVAGIFPARMDSQKQVDKAIRIYAGLKRAGKSVSFLVADAYATGERFKEYKKRCSDIARLQGLNEKEFAFLGEEYEECMYSTPRPVVKALMEMGNLFIQPSNSETSSLVVLEAALAGNLLVINSDFAPIHHLYEAALSLPFGSITQEKPTEYYRHVKTAKGSEIKIPDPQQYWDDEARSTIVPILDSQLSLSIKRQQVRERWQSVVFKSYIEPLINELADPRPIELHGDQEVTAIITSLDNLPMLQKQIEILTAECGHVIVVNNGSRDGTREWLETTPLANVSYINRENKGAGPGRNAGLDMWANSTPYTLMIDGGILPPRGGVDAMKAILELHSEIDVISPEVETCFTTDEDEATLRVTEPLPDQHFEQRCISSTAFALCRARAWDGIRLSEEGPFGEPGWGVDDQDLQYRWNDAGILHHDITHGASGWKLLRRKSGSFARIYEETGIWANQYGSVYEKRNVKCFQDWYKHHSWVFGSLDVPSSAYVIRGVPMPEFAMLVKWLHFNDKYCEIVCQDNSDPEVQWWLDTFALRWQWGDCTIDPDGKILKRGVDYPEELWSGNVVTNRGPLVDALVITPDKMGVYLKKVGENVTA